MTHNPKCDSDNCRSEIGEVRLYPMGGEGNAILCHACWAHENIFRFNRGNETGEPQNWPQHNWHAAEMYDVA